MHELVMIKNRKEILIKWCWCMLQAAENASSSIQSNQYYEMVCVCLIWKGEKVATMTNQDRLFSIFMYCLLCTGLSISKVYDSESHDSFGSISLFTT